MHDETSDRPHGSEHPRSAVPARRAGGLDRTGGAAPAYPPPLNPAATWIFALGAGVATAAMHLEAALLSFAVLAVALVGVWRVDPKAFSSVAQGYDQKTVEKTDFDSRRFTIPAIITIGGPLLGQLLPAGAFDLPPELTAVGTGALAAVAAGFAVNRANRRAVGAGRRRLREVVRHADLENVTAERIVAAEADGDVLRALVRLGAVNGIRVRLWLLGQALGLQIPRDGGPRALPADQDVPREPDDPDQARLDLDALHAACRRLAAAGLVAVSGVDAGDNRALLLIDLTVTGACTLRAIQEGR